MKGLSFALLLSACLCARGQALAGGVSQGEPDFLEASAAPAYHAVERLSDGFFSVVRSHLIGSLFPSRLARHLGDAPRAGSFSTFAARFREKESRFLGRASAGYPAPDRGGLRSPAKVAAWQAHLAEGQFSVLTESLGDSLLQRYKLRAFGRRSGRYAADRRNWDPGFLAMAGLVGSAILYIDGLHTDVQVRGLKAALDLRPAMKLRRAFEAGAGSRLAGLELSYRSCPVALQADWGLKAGRLAAERIGLRYALKY